MSLFIFCILSTLPATSILIGFFVYIAFIAFRYTLKSASSSYIFISCAIIPFSFSTFSSVKYGFCT